MSDQVSVPAASEPKLRRAGSGRKPAGVGAIILGSAILAVVALFGFKIIRLGPSDGGLTGAVITPPFQAPDFQLQDQFDRAVRLSDQRGKVVVLSFLYTNCPDTCPIITERIHQAYGLLGPETTKVSLLAVTVDPARDTIAQVRAYSTSKDMLDKWHFLVGPEAAVAPVWASYGIEAVNLDAQAARARVAAASAGAATPTPLPGTGLVNHASPTFLIDKTGKARAILDVNFVAADLVQSVRALLAE